MANIKSAKKRVRINEEQRVKNQAFRSSMRTAVKEFDKKVDNNDVEGANEIFTLAVQKIDKAADKNMIHKNRASRKKSRIQQRLNEVNQ
ncbi:small subunit ribosomal protein S20 [Salsuginibacillus halophilus]|uniref:Small ribosomal subunit protein bS20 n=1 Tax=Salsuginibacillus halophilus TaxID=517424 RepID=A0A2P8HFN9_9BACI|nr:30S ribosomal protein S20 [Salsuginibacillus halophilus]PSL45042.1 small subunit ribosomal protein S20 [Salsuginibacillus halophilus]